MINLHSKEWRFALNNRLLARAQSHSRMPALWWLFPNLLSLDAPVLAFGWQTAVSRLSGRPATRRERATLFLAVWSIYLADRLLDGRDDSGWHAPRRIFSDRAQKSLWSICCINGLAGLTMSRDLSPKVLQAGLLVGAATAFHLGLSALRNRLQWAWWPREWIVALLFVTGASLTGLESIDSRARLRPYLIYFLALCLIDASILEVWEWERNRQVTRPSLWARATTRHLGILSLSTLVLATASARRDRITWRYVTGIGTSLLYWLVCSRGRGRLGAESLTLAVDAGLVPAMVAAWK